ncbi:hypothetical protein Nepgr_023046 [Nepenthes gracilis]|uniref:Uncharacterized protein n=1 Tax=Nepenthes gracilis TaxID=150966 RepID=A0AAD3T1W5_NEPGR|nr:hypothetical protein Nepgr_023046 [Nepenthes gracilis]
MTRLDLVIGVSWALSLVIGNCQLEFRLSILMLMFCLAAGVIFGLCYGAVLEPFAGVLWSAAVSAAAMQSRVSSLAFIDAEVYSLEDPQTPLEDPSVDVLLLRCSFAGPALLDAVGMSH